MMPLTMAGIGEVNTILKIGGNEETRRFLANLGFVTGTEISVVSAIGSSQLRYGKAYYDLTAPGFKIAATLYACIH